MNQSWTDTIRYIQQECTSLHLWYSTEQGWCYVTDRNGNRQRIDSTMSPVTVNQIIDAAHAGRIYSPMQNNFRFTK